MHFASYLSRVLICGLLAVAVSAPALAKKGHGGGGGGGGGDGGHGSRSFSGSGGGGSSHISSGSGRSFSSRSFGGGSGGMTRGSSGGPSMSHSFHSKSFSAGNSGGGGSSHSRSSNGGSSFRRSSGVGGPSSGGQVLQQQSYNSSGSSKRWNGGSGSSISSNGGRAEFRPPTRGEFQPRSLNDNRGSGGASLANGGSGSGNNSPRWSNNGDKGGSQSDFSRRNFTAARPTNDQVQNFLKLPKENGEAMRDNNALPGGGRNWADRGGFHKDSVSSDKGPGSDNRTYRFNNDQLDTNGKNGAKWSDKFGDNHRDHDGPGNALGDGPSNKDGKWSDQFGDNKRGDDPNGGSKWHGGRDGDFIGNHGFSDGGGPNRGTSLVDKHKNWDGKKGDWQVGDRHQGDHRDLSGKWNDGHRFNASNDLRHGWRNYHGNDRPFHGNWWNKNHFYGHGNNWCWGVFSNWHGHRPYYWWNWCSAPRLNTWFTFGWGTPYYWDYGPGEYIYCANDVIYVNGRWFAPAPVYYQQTQVLAQRVPDWTPEQAAQVEWLPLGVFAVTRDGVADNNLVVQLAVTNDGVIGGTAFNKAAGNTYAVQGTVDKQSQRAVWSYVDEKDARVTMETGVYNLTQPECTALAHYGPQNIQVIQLVRLEQPPAGDEAAKPAAEIPKPVSEELPKPAAQGAKVILPPQTN